MSIEVMGGGGGYPEYVTGSYMYSGIDSNLGTAIRTSVVLVMAWLMVFVKNKQSEIISIDIKELLVN